MTIDTTPQCSLGLTTKELSTWRANGLPAAEAERVSNHVPTCTACQTHLAAYDMIDEALRVQQVPAYDPGGWGPLQNRMRQQPQGQVVRHRQRRIGGGLAAVAAVLLIVLGFVQVFGSRTGQAPSNSTQLAWQQATVPLGIARGYVRSSWHPLPIAASDANTLYGCEMPRDADSSASGSPQFWVTHERGNRWTQQANIPISRQDASLCYLTSDDLNSDTVVAVVGWPQASLTRVFSPDQAASFVTRDGGKTWQRLADPRSFRIGQLATYQGWVVAYFDAEDPADKRLMASSDGMQTWHPIDQPIYATGQHVWQFIFNPASNTIFAQVGKDGDSTRQLWVTADRGVTWMHMPTPNAAAFFIGMDTTSSQPPYICATQYAIGPSVTVPNALMCSADSGQHWAPRPLLAGVVHVPLPHDPQHTTSIVSPRILGVTAGGAVLAMDTGQTTHVLYRLPAGTDQWQLVGSLPAPGNISIRYLARPGNGVLWAYDSNDTASDIDRLLYTADYR